MSTNSFFKIALVLLTFFIGANNADAQKFDIVFVDHLAAGMIEQDVFVEKAPGTGQIYRVSPDEKAKCLNAPLYKSVEEIDHDPFNKRNAGPFVRGEEMGMTLGEWLGAKGKATYSAENGWAHFTAEFTGLVPNATYTMWHAFMVKDQVDPFPGAIELPMGDRDGSQAVFITDDKGNAKMDIRFDRLLQLSDSQLMAAIAIAYHSDGKTYGYDAGDFGSVSHVQLLAILPETSDVHDIAIKQ